ncbi:MAG: hypothetical protein ABSF33_02170 [Acidimicrobiales bacterium]
MSDSTRSTAPGSEGEDRAQIDPPEEATASEISDPSREHGFPPPSRQIRTSPPRLIRESGLFVWLWVIGAVVLIAIIIIIAMALPSKKSVGPVQHSVPAQKVAVAHN